MTEQEWLAADDPRPMLEFLGNQASDRRLWLFACAACRRYSHVFGDAASRTAVEVGERYADCRATDTELDDASNDAFGHRPNFVGREVIGEIAVASAFAVVNPANRDPNVPAFSTAQAVQRTMDDLGLVAEICSDRDKPAAERDPRRAVAVERAEQVALLRHIFGNPFRPYAAPASWPSVVVDLAQGLYDGRGDRLIFADALEEAGHTELAEHFRAEEWHPKGCWAVDLVLGKG
ncbi:hypothetical protein AYO44_16365 [Planctomycetaceae bacterium SCGC AG-212-F19]|nr:hypothetical protein AYO44_16365 [Planctomycetaceae bacterium SCGC AG-212-F19]